jgi:vacuolar-type H+-ATPase subunit I/STV1
MEGSIQFVANYDDWKAIKKQTITEKTDPLTVMEFLASLTTSVDNKVEANLKKKVALDKLDMAINSLGLTKGDAVKAMEEINSRTISKVINEISQIPDLQKNQQKEIADFCKAYAFRKCLKACGLLIDYSQIEIPGMGRLKKKIPKDAKE